MKTGRYVGTAEEDRICTLCDLKDVEDEMHFVLHCPFYDSCLRQKKTV